MRRRLLDRLLLPARVQAVEQRDPQMRQIALTGPGMAGLTWVPGQHGCPQVAEAHSSVDWLVGPLRTYSVWDYDGQTDFDLAWTYREGRSAASSESMVAAVRELDLPAEPGPHLIEAILVPEPSTGPEL